MYRFIFYFWVVVFVTDTSIADIDGVQIFANEIESALAVACEREQVEDLKKATQGEWKAVCKTVGDIVFNNKSKLKSKELNIYINNNIPTNNNAYDYNIISELLEYFCYLSNRYSKLVSLEAFSLFLNMPRETIRQWSLEEPSSLRFAIAKKIKETRLESVLDRAADNGNVTGTMFVGNVEYGLNLPGATREVVHRQEISVQEALKIDKNSE